MLTPELTDTMA